MKYKEPLIALGLVAVVAAFLATDNEDPTYQATRSTTSRLPTTTTTPSREPHAFPGLPESPIPLDQLNPIELSTKETLLEDLEYADGMWGYEELQSITPPPPTRESLAWGSKLYQLNCASCHGVDMWGDGPAGISLDPKPRNLRNPDENKYGQFELSLYRTTWYGVEGTGMAPWGDILNPEETWAIVHYLRSVQEYSKQTGLTQPNSTAPEK